MEQEQEQAIKPYVGSPEDIKDATDDFKLPLETKRNGEIGQKEV
jgi:hypothetical protein